MKKQIIILIIFLFLFFVPNSVDSFQSSKNRDVPIELMPRKQKDLCTISYYWGFKKSELYFRKQNRSLNTRIHY